MTKMANLLRAAREKKGWSLRETARQSGLPVSTLSKLEAGTLQNPTFATIVAISNALGLKGKSWEALFEPEETK